MKVHLYEDSDPLPMNVHGVTAQCGRLVYPAQVVYMRDGGVFSKELVYTPYVCRKCFDLPMAGKRYLYGVANAEEVRQSHV